MLDSARTTREFIEQIRQASDAELLERLRHYQEALQNLRFRLASGQIEDPTMVRKYKKAIARIKTELRERELGIRPGPGQGQAQR